MGIIEIEAQEQIIYSNLLSSTKIGRHWSNTVQVITPEMPIYWLEIRWQQGGWFWRSLNAETETRGMGAMSQYSWRSLQKMQTIRLDGTVLVRCVDDSEPELIVEDILTKKQVVGEQVFELIEQIEDGIFPLGKLETHAPLVDGDIFLLANRSFRIHIPHHIIPTEHHILHLQDSDLWLEINLLEQQATFGNSKQEIKLTGASVLVLWVYAKAICESLGWLSARAC